MQGQSLIFNYYKTKCLQMTSRQPCLTDIKYSRICMKKKKKKMTSVTTWSPTGITSNRYGLKLAKKSLGKKKRRHKPWISAESLRKIEERKLKKDLVNRSRTRAAKTRAQQQYSQAHKEVHKTGQAQIYRGSSETSTRSSDAEKHEGAL